MAILTGFRKSFTVQGRASRPEFWWFWSFHFLVPLVLIFVLGGFVSKAFAGLAQALVLAGMALYVLSTPASFCALVRRQHDVGKSGKPAGLVYIGMIIAAIATGLFLVSEASQIDPFLHFRDPKLQENPLAFAAALPVLAIGSFAQIVMFAFFAITVLFFVGPPLLLALLILGIGLARPSDPGSNIYGPNPHEVIS